MTLSSGTDSRGSSGDELDPLEQMIAEAGAFVQPSQDLRPEIMAATRQHVARKKIACRAAIGALLAMVLWGVGVMMLESAREYRPAITGPTSSEVEQLAEDIASRSYRNTGSLDDGDWGMVEAFSQIREVRSPATTTSLATPDIGAAK